MVTGAPQTKIDEAQNILVSDDKQLLDIEVIHDFLKRSSWAAKRTRETLVKSIQNSYCFGAYQSGKQIAFARRPLEPSQNLIN